MVEAIRESLDTGEEFPTDYSDEITDVDGYMNISNQSAIHAMAEVLLRFLDSLQDSVVPSSLYYRCLDVGPNQKEAALQVFQSI